MVAKKYETKELKEEVVLKKKIYSFPEFGVVIEATSIEEAQRILESRGLTKEVGLAKGPCSKV